MKALLQRVKKADVKVSNNIVGEIDKGLLIFIGVFKDDEIHDIEFLVEKLVNLRIFENEQKPMDKSVLDIKGELLIVSQFTLCASTKKGRRPDFTEAADPGKALDLYEKFIEKCKEHGLKVEKGEFGAMMDISLINDGPVTIMLDSKSN